MLPEREREIFPLERRSSGEGKQKLDGKYPDLARKYHPRGPLPPEL